MQFTDSSGVVHEKSYWIPTRITIDKTTKTANVDFHGYSSKDARKRSMSPVGSLFYLVKDEEFEELFSVPELSKEGTNPIKQAYKLAERYLENDGRSFFDQAIDE